MRVRFCFRAGTMQDVWHEEVEVDLPEQVLDEDEVDKLIEADLVQWVLEQVDHWFERIEERATE